MIPSALSGKNVVYSVVKDPCCPAGYEVPKRPLLLSSVLLEPGGRGSPAQSRIKSSNSAHSNHEQRLRDVEHKTRLLLGGPRPGRFGSAQAAGRMILSKDDNMMVAGFEQKGCVYLIWQ